MGEGRLVAVESFGALFTSKFKLFNLTYEAGAGDVLTENDSRSLL